MIDIHYVKDEMLVHIPICTHNQPKSILVIGGCEKLPKEIKKYSDISNIKIIRVDDNIINSIQSLEDNSFDVAIIANRDYLKDKIFIGIINNKLTDKGVLSILAYNIFLEEENFKKQLLTLGKFFKIVMPYSYESYKENKIIYNSLILASQKYHPTADINLQRADLTDNIQYYNSDIAIGTFQLSTLLKKRYLGFIKN